MIYYTIVHYINGKIFYYRGFCIDNVTSHTPDWTGAAMYHTRDAAQSVLDKIIHLNVRMIVEEHMISNHS